MTEENLTFLKGQIGILTNAIFDYDNCRSYCSSCILCERDEVNEELIFHCSSDAKLLDFFRRILSNELTQSLCENETKT